MHAADISIGDDETAENRLNIKLQQIDQVLRDIYGATPSVLEAYADGRTNEQYAALAEDGGERGTLGSAGIESFARVAAILNNRTETIDDRIKDLKTIKTITIGAPGISVSDTAEDANTVNLVADNNHDTITISTLDKWIVLNANASADSFTIGHYKAAFTPTTAIYDFNTTVSASVVPAQSTFAIPVLTYDEAGHITAKETTTYTLPNNYKAFLITNSNAVTGITTSISPDKVSAQNILGEITFAAGNKWIELASSNTNQTITIAHSISALTAEEHATNWMVRLKKVSVDQSNNPILDGNNQPVMVINNQVPLFGETFKILVPEISFTTDAGGHVIAYSNDYIEPTIQIPQGSISDNAKGTKNVMTGLSLTQSTMAFSREWSYLADLLLTNYEYTANYPVRPIVDGTQATQTYTLDAGDSLKQALSKLQGYAVSNHNAIDQEVSDRETAITNLIDSASTDYNTLGKLETKVKEAKAAADDAQNDIDTHEDDTSNPHSVTASQVGLGNLTNDKQVKATSTTVVSGNIAIWNGTTGDLLSDSGFTIASNVPQNAEFTDTKFQANATATDSVAGFVKLYTSPDVSKTDGAITAAAMVDIINNTINTTLSNLFNNFDMSTVHFIMPTSVTWGTETIDGNDYLTYQFDNAFENKHYTDYRVYIKTIEDATWTLVTEPVAALPGEYQLRVIREIENVKQDVWTASNTYTINAPEPEPDPEEP